MSWVLGGSNLISVDDLGCAIGTCDFSDPMVSDLQEVAIFYAPAKNLCLALNIDLESDLDNDLVGAPDGG